MSCGPVEGKFRLLDANVGWSEAAAPEHLVGLDQAQGLRLALQDPGAVDMELWSWILPPRLARGCAPCDWYLLTPAPTRLLRRGACQPAWEPVWTPACDPARFVRPIAVAAWQHRVAVADPGAGRVWVWSQDGGSLLAEIRIADPAAIGFGEHGQLWLATPHELRCFGPSGDPRGPARAVPAGAGQPCAVVGDSAGGVWLVTKASDGTLHLWRAARGSDRLVAATLEELRAAGLPRTGLSTVTPEGFCRHQPGAGEPAGACCWTWYGRDATEAEIGLPAAPSLHTGGRLLTQAIDSGMPQCRWHRVQLDADVPPGTALVVQTATSDDAAATPDPADWRPAPAGALDFLVDQPPGRFLLLQVAFSGDGARTPVLRRVRLDFPRSTSLDHLPPVYRENPRAEDFSERFLGLFDASIGELDAAIEQFPRALDVASARAELLPWLGGFLDLAFDPAWEPERQRAILAALPRLYRQRGTVGGLQLAIRLVFDAEPAIQELAAERAWGTLGSGGRAVLGGVRLFGQSKARLRLGRSALGQAPIKSFGNPDLDAVGTGAYRFRVLVPPGGRLAGDAALQRLQRLVDSQKPAHTQATVRGGGSGFVLGAFSAIGIDSVLGPLPAPVLGAAGNVRLGRMSVLRPGPRGRRAALVLGNPVVAGLHTVLE
jgi:phage tail-like protein